MAFAVHTFGGLDVLVDNAGIGDTEPIDVTCTYLVAGAGFDPATCGS